MRKIKMLFTAIVFALAGCAGDGTGETASTATASFASIQTNVFDAFCISCHSGASAPQGLKLDSANSAGIVSTPSAQQPAVNLIEPGFPDNSYLVMKVRGDVGITGNQMPFGGTPLSAGNIQALEDWTTNGADTTN